MLCEAKRRKEAAQKLSEPRQKRRIAIGPTQGRELCEKLFAPGKLRALEATARGAQQIFLRRKRKREGIPGSLGTRELPDQRVSDDVRGSGCDGLTPVLNLGERRTTLPRTRQRHWTAAAKAAFCFLERSLAVLLCARAATGQTSCCCPCRLASLVAEKMPACRRERR